MRIHDHAAHPENNSRYPDATWQRWFENDVQYVNRLQPSEFVAIFTAAGFEVLAETVVGRCDSGKLRIAPQFERFSREKPDVCVNRRTLCKPA